MGKIALMAFIAFVLILLWNMYDTRDMGPHDRDDDD